MKQGPGNQPLDIRAALDELAELLAQTSAEATNWRTLMGLLAKRCLGPLSSDEIVDQIAELYYVRNGMRVQWQAQESQGITRG